LSYFATISFHQLLQNHHCNLSSRTGKIGQQMTSVIMD
jgi:uncharacterized membrane protein